MQDNSDKIKRNIILNKVYSSNLISVNGRIVTLKTTAMKTIQMEILMLKIENNSKIIGGSRKNA